MLGSEGGCGLSGPQTSPYILSLPCSFPAPIPFLPFSAFALPSPFPVPSSPPSLIIQILPSSSGLLLRSHLLQEAHPNLPPLILAPCPCPFLSAVDPNLFQKSLPLALSPHRCPAGLLNLPEPLVGGPVALSPHFLPTMQALVLLGANLFPALRGPSAGRG